MEAFRGSTGDESTRSSPLTLFPISFISLAMVRLVPEVQIVYEKVVKQTASQ
jgi:hypothetical protein